jgi:hypothetical protein
VNEFTNDMDYKICAMDVIFDDGVKGVEVCYV